MTSILTDIRCQATDGREKDFDVGTGDELGIHASGVLEERAAQKALRAVRKLDISHAMNGALLTSQSAPRRRVDTTQVPRRPY